jgi:hypothetical protein
MKWLSAGLTFVNVAAVLALLLGMMAGGLGRGIALASFLVASLVAVLAYFTTNDDRAEVKAENPAATAAAKFDFRRIGFWALAGCFAFFAFRAFCWLLYIDGNQLKIQSVNNLGDLSLHITYIRTFANGVALWPDNPIFVFSKLRYPAGTDIFNAISLLLGLDITRGLVWAGLLGSLATFYALYRWAGLFGIAGFLFNGGFFQLFQSLKLRDFPGDKVIAWKSIALTMFVTQRGLLYALPAGLLLLFHWRAKYFARPNETTGDREGRGILPFWIELSLYASMPLFHVHTFIALSVVAAFFFLIGDKAMRKHFAALVGGAFLPATFFVWLITDHFQARSLMRFHWGWVQTTPGDFAAPFLGFWFLNFGVLCPLLLALIAVCIWRAFKTEGRFNFKANPSLAFLAPALLLFLFACTVKTAPWEWDNIKIIVWAYLIVLPILWTELIARWPEPARSITCVTLFISGSMALFNGLADKSGYGIGDRAEIDAVGAALRKLPVEARFAAYPTYNHPLLLQGRKLVLGYPGHLWTQGFDYIDPMMRLEKLMRGTPDWREQARYLRARYLFFGREEKTNYATSTRAWEREARLVASGNWGAIYDLEASPSAGPTRQ